MYETEVNHRRETADALPTDIARQFADRKGKILSKSLLPWSEHCTECVWPTCYTTCDLYEARSDGKCRRFADGMVRVDLPDSPYSYLLKVRFKRWGKLWTPGSIDLYSSAEAAKLELRDYRIGNAVQALPSLVRITATKRRYGFKNRTARAARNVQELPTCFLLECYNPEIRTVSMSLTMRPTDQRSKMPYQKLLELAPGFHRFRIPVSEISTLIDLRREFDIELVPNDESELTTLYFGLMDFVVESPESKKIKCVVWDLDHTMWHGVLVEDGAEELRLKPGIREIIQGLDSRGILQSIASKNNAEEALGVIKKFELDQYFLYPQISWNPKSTALRAIAKQLNIGLDTFLFIDDSQFEREEVKTALPEVRTLAAEEYSSLLSREEFQVPITEDSKQRRTLYQVEMDRQTLAQNFSHDYLAFLRNCEIELRLSPMTEENLERVHELTQRTNQMNFSGNRYDRNVLRSLLANPHLDTFVLSCADRFGSYGIIGFCIVDRQESRMTDLMFSCRIQSKRVEHAFLAFLMRKYIAETGRDFHADYRKTPRNAPSGQVFADMGMEELENRDGVLRLCFRRDSEVPDDGVIRILTAEAETTQPV
jgi:FkbH-like protein